MDDKIYNALSELCQKFQIEATTENINAIYNVIYEIAIDVVTDKARDIVEEQQERDRRLNLGLTNRYY